MMILNVFDCVVRRTSRSKLRSLWLLSTNWYIVSFFWRFWRGELIIRSILLMLYYCPSAYTVYLTRRGRAYLQIKLGLVILSWKKLGSLLSFKSADLLLQRPIAIKKWSKLLDLEPFTERLLFSEKDLLCKYFWKLVKFVEIVRFKWSSFIFRSTISATAQPLIINFLSNVIVLVWPKTFHKISHCEDCSCLKLSLTTSALPPLR